MFLVHLPDGDQMIWLLLAIIFVALPLFGIYWLIKTIIRSMLNRRGNRPV